MADEVIDLGPGVRADLAELLGVSPDHVSRMRRRLGFPDMRFNVGRRRALPDSARKEFVTLSRRLTPAQVAAHFQLSARTVQRYRARWMGEAVMKKAPKKSLNVATRRCQCGRMYADQDQCPGCGAEAGE